MGSTLLELDERSGGYISRGSHVAESHTRGATHSLGHGQQCVHQVLEVPKFTKVRLECISSRYSPKTSPSSDGAHMQREQTKGILAQRARQSRKVVAPKESQGLPLGLYRSLFSLQTRSYFDAILDVPCSFINVHASPHDGRHPGVNFVLSGMAQRQRQASRSHTRPTLLGISSI